MSAGFSSIRNVNVNCFSVLPQSPSKGTAHRLSSSMQVSPPQKTVDLFPFLLSIDQIGPSNLTMRLLQASTSDGGSTGAKTLHLQRHGQTVMNVFLSQRPYGSPGFVDPLM